MNKIQRIIMSLLVCILLIPGITVNAEESMQPIYGEQIQDGTYEITVESSSSMFRVVKAELSVKESKMTAVLTLSGVGYEKLYMGTGEQAEADTDDNCIYFVEDAEGKYTYEVPVEALNQDTDVAAFSIKKQKWYDRVLVFQADRIPAPAIKTEEIFTTEEANKTEEMLTEEASEIEETPTAEEPSETEEILTTEESSKTEENIKTTDPLQDGKYTIEAKLSGGTGRSTIVSPVELEVVDGKQTATIVWDSPNYDFMLIAGNYYYPITEKSDAETTVFQIPVADVSEVLEVQAETLAMSEPHVIAYTIQFDADTLTPIKKADIARIVVLGIIVVVLLCGGFYWYHRKAGKQV